jgi:hypothetical protein
MDRPRATDEDRTSEPQVTVIRQVFSLVCRVEVNIRATAPTIWHILSDAKGFPRWNSTITRIDGDIRDGELLRLHVPGTDRTFTPRVSGLVPNQRMTWAGGIAPIFSGVRTFVLRPRADGSTDFAMDECFSGVMLPLIARFLPDFGPVFASFASDLTREAERPSARANVGT